MSDIQEKENFIKDLEKSLNDICSKSKISEQDKNITLKAIHEIRNVSEEDETEMETVVSEAYGYLNLISNKAMYNNICELNKSVKETPVNAKVKAKMLELETNLGKLVNAMEKRNFIEYEESAQKVVELGGELKKMSSLVSPNIGISG